MDENFEIIDNVTPKDWVPDVSMIKVIGIGGGGCNAVTYMYNQKVKGCNFIVCNTDAQALRKSNVPIKIQLGEGLGAVHIQAEVLGDVGDDVVAHVG